MLGAGVVKLDADVEPDADVEKLDVGAEVLRPSDRSPASTSRLSLLHRLAELLQEVLGAVECRMAAARLRGSRVRLLSTLPSEGLLGDRDPGGSRGP